MEEYTFSSLFNMDSGYARLVESIVEKYKCDWDDIIHDSFFLYVEKVQENSLRTHEIRCNAETLGKEVEELRIDEKIRQAEDLCKEVASL